MAMLKSGTNGPIRADLLLHVYLNNIVRRNSMGIDTQPAWD
jgi:hypothetical protein